MQSVILNLIPSCFFVDFVTLCLILLEQKNELT